MNLRTTTVALAFAAASVAPAYAQKLAEPVVEPVIAPVQAPLFSWAGGYAGAQLGYGWADTDASDAEDLDFGDRIDNTEDAIRSIGEDGDGITGGVHAGYLLQNNNFVYGGELAYDWTDIDLDDDAGNIDGVAQIKARAGYSFGRTLVYGVGGAVYGSADLVGDSYNDWGWAIGAGVDYLVTENISLGAELLYSDYGEFDDSNVDVSLTTLSARLAFRF